MSAPRKLTPELLRGLPLPQPEEDGDKDARGRVLVVAGSLQVPGAAVLAGTSALRAGAGKLQLATVSGVAEQIAVAVPEALVIGLQQTGEGGVAPMAADVLEEHVERCDALLVGPGMMDKAAVEGLTPRLLALRPGRGLVLDAAVLACLADQSEAVRRHGGRVVITPHAGEMAGLLGMEKAEVEADPPRAARLASELLGAVVVLKGRESWIVNPEGEAFLNVDGDVGLATSGSGDTLAGLITGLLARGAAPLQAALFGVHVHAAAGARLGTEYGGIGYLARELPALFPRVLGDLARSGARA